MCVVNENSLITGFLNGDTMVHEFAHAIHMHLYREDVELIRKAYNNAVNKHIYHAKIYMMENSFEYWAVATQIWFDVGLGTTNSEEIMDRQHLIDRDPELAQLLATIYGPTEISMF
ncbi:MAG: hypothetical protein H7328_12325 [Bdellovibrio sp.]|nr:hypothetical protein [Bdellovibrio sp.]